MHKTISLKLKKSDNLEISIFGTKNIYPSNGEEASSWIREQTNDLEVIDAPQMSSYYGIKQSGCGNLVKDAIGYMHSNANSVYYNSQFVGLYSSAFSGGHGVSVTTNNFMRCMALFTARKCIPADDWITNKDEYLIPQTNHPEYEQWNKDAIIYSLFNNSSQQSSLRNITYKEKEYDIKNNFFFMSVDDITTLANKNNFNKTYQDSKINKNSFVYSLLQEINFTDDAKNILSLASDLVVESFPIRQVWDESVPEHYVWTWDAGWAQLKPMLNQYFPNKLINFNESYKNFENRMREGVFKFKFLN